jgi:hypothetical protein
MKYDMLMLNYIIMTCLVSLEAGLDLIFYLLVYLVSFESRTRSKFIRVFLLPIILSILVGHDFYRLHSQITSTFLNFFLASKVLVINLS